MGRPSTIKDEKAKDCKEDLQSQDEQIPNHPKIDEIPRERQPIIISARGMAVGAPNSDTRAWDLSKPCIPMRTPVNSSMALMIRPFFPRMWGTAPLATRTSVQVAVAASPPASQANASVGGLAEVDPLWWDCWRSQTLRISTSSTSSIFKSTGLLSRNWTEILGSAPSSPQARRC